MIIFPAIILMLLFLTSNVVFALIKLSQTKKNNKELILEIIEYFEKKEEKLKKKLDNNLHQNLNKFNNLISNLEMLEKEVQTVTEHNKAVTTEYNKSFNYQYSAPDDGLWNLDSKYIKAKLRSSCLSSNFGVISVKNKECFLSADSKVNCYPSEHLSINIGQSIKYFDENENSIEKIFLKMDSINQ